MAARLRSSYLLKVSLWPLAGSRSFEHRTELDFSSFPSRFLDINLIWTSILLVLAVKQLESVKNAPVRKRQTRNTSFIKKKRKTLPESSATNMEEPPSKGNDNPTADIIGGDIQDTEPTVDLEPFEGGIGAMTKFRSPGLEKDRG